MPPLALSGASPKRAHAGTAKRAAEHPIHKHAQFALRTTSPSRDKERTRQQQPTVLPSAHLLVLLSLSSTMAAINKIAVNSPSRQNPSELESAIGGALFDLESNTQDLKATLRPLQFVSAREVRSFLFLASVVM